MVTKLDKNIIDDKSLHIIYFSYISLTCLLIAAGISINIPYLGRSLFVLYFSIGLSLVIIIKREKYTFLYPFLGLPGFLVLLRQVLSDPYMQQIYFHVPNTFFK